MLLAGLFWVAFISATLLPAQSELALAGILLTQSCPAWLAILVAWLGNTLGSCLNWLLGSMVLRCEGKKWFPVSRANLSRAENWYARYGRWSLLLSWAPIIGDPLTLAAGLLGEKLAPFLAIVALAKLARYLVIALCLPWTPIYPLAAA